MAHRPFLDRPTRTVTVLLLPLALGDCANLGAVQEFARLSADGLTFQRINDD